MAESPQRAARLRFGAQMRPGRRLFATALVFSLLLVGVGGAFAWRAYADMQADREARLVGLAETGAAISERFLRARLDQLDAIAATDVVTAGDPVGMHAYFSALEPRQGVFTGGIGFVDLRGVLRVSSGVPLAPTGSDLGNRDYVRWTLRNRRPFVGRAVPGRTANDPVIPLAVPAHDGEGHLSGLVVGLIRLVSRVSQDLESLHALSRDLVVIDRTGQLILDSSEEGILGRVANPELVRHLRAEGEGFVETGRGVRGQPDRAIGFAALRTGGWIVLASQPKGALYGPPRARLALTLGLLGLVALLALTMAFLAGRRLDRTMQQREELHWYERRLEQAVSSLAAATTAGAVLEATGSSTTDVLELTAVDVVRRAADGSCQVVWSSPDDGGGRVVDAVRVGRALDRGAPVWDESGAGGTGGGGSVALPVGVDTVLTVALSAGRRLDQPQRSFLLALADSTRGALARARLHADVQAAESSLREQRGLLEAALVRERESGRRIQLLLSVAARLAGAATSGAIARVLADETKPALEADTVLVFLTRDGHEGLELVEAQGCSAAIVERLRLVELDAGLPSAGARRTRETIVLESFDEAVPRYPHLEGFRGIWRSALFAPVCDEQRVLAVLCWGFASPRTFDLDFVRLAEAIADQATLALDRARLFEIEHRTAIGLQRSLLPRRLPAVPAAQFAARYQAGAENLEVGGDWYDVLELPTGRAGLVLGDVVGRGLRAAAAMGQLRSAVAALARVTEGPGALLEQLESFAARTDGAEFATIAYAVLDPVTGLVRYACAAHPPPLLVEPGGAARYLEGGRSTPLCGIGGEQRAEEALRLATGCTIVLYSDGLVERRGASLDRGLERLRLAAQKHAGLGTEAFGDAILEEMMDDEHVTDDVALLVAQTRDPPESALGMRVPARADQIPVLRQALRGWLAREHVPRDVSEEVVLAAGEAVSNAVEHAYARAGDARGTVDLVAWTSDTDRILRLEVSDHGSWRLPRDDPDRGRGLSIMRAVLDSVHVVQTPDGTSVSMSRALRA